MGDHLRAGKPSRRVTSYLGRFSLLPLWDGKMSTSLRADLELEQLPGPT